jgi:cytochrome c-type biogenesis protein CcsB
MNKILWGFKTTAILLIIFTLSVITATIIESRLGTQFAFSAVYHSFWFEILLALLAINVTGSMFHYRSFSLKKITVPLFHLAFMLIIMGAFFTHHFGKDGIVSIREGEKTNQVIHSDNKISTLPFEINLTDFVLERYPGSQSPSSYSSYVKVSDSEKDQHFDYHIYMNHILHYRGWRFFQTSYDSDEKGTILTATRDTIGTPLTYTGYALAIFLMISSLFMPGSYFRKLLSELKKSTVIILLIITPLIAISKPVDPSKVVGKKQASDFGELIIQDSKGRMKPMNTLNNEFMRKIYGKETFEGLSSNQVVLSMAVYPDYWKNVPLIKVKNEEIKNTLSIGSSHIPFSALLDKNGEYRLAEIANRAFMSAPATRTATDKALIKLDENVNIFSHFLRGDAYAIFPSEKAENNKWHTPTDAALFTSNPEDSLFVANVFKLYLLELVEGNSNIAGNKAEKYLDAIKMYQQTIGKKVLPSPTKIKAELFYNKANIFNLSTYALLAAGLSLLFFFFYTTIKGAQLSNNILLIYKAIAVILLTFVASGIALRWYIGGYIPMSNSYEVTIFIAWVSLLTGLLLCGKQPVVLALSMILSFAFLLVSAMNNGNPEIGTLVPVLKSYWLSIHVAVITSSYALFALAMMLALVNLSMFAFIPSKKFEGYLKTSKQIMLLEQILIIPGLYLLTIGTILGAVWANESWGRYWGWDPKESWALISIIVYALVSHLRLIPSFKDEIWFDLSVFWAFASVVMTFWGVNYLLSGLHSYGQNGQGEIPIGLTITLIVLIVFSAFAIVRRIHLSDSSKNTTA